MFGYVMEDLMEVAERTFGKAVSRTGERTLGALTLVALGISAVLSLVVAPADAIRATCSG